LGYQVQFVSVSAAHAGGEGNPHAPQWRDRLYLVFTRNGVQLPDVEPRPAARCLECGQDVAALQSWTRGGRRIGKYRQQYWYVCPNATCRHARVEPYVSPAASAIDWSDLGTRIGDRPRPLAVKTLARIEAGLAMFAESAACPPVMVGVNHDGPVRAYQPEQAPLPSRTAKIGDGLVCAPFIAELRGGGSVARRACDPLATVTAGGLHHGLTVPPGDLGDMPDRAALVIPFRRGAKPYPPGQQPLSTVATREQHGLMAAGIDVQDCRFRMLSPREHLRAQRFPDSYVVTGNKGEQTMQAGNAVAANVAQWLATRVALVLGGAA